MKIRLILFLFSSFLIQTKQLCGQTNEFAPVGAKWYYEILGGLPFETPNGYYSIECMKDSIIEGIPCRYLESYFVIDNITIENTHFFTYQQEDTIFYFIDSLLGEQIHTSFQVLYIFNSAVGDTWDVSYGDYTGVGMSSPCPEDEYNFIVVDSINVEEINEVNLKKISYHTDFADSDSQWEFEGDAYEIIGNTFYLLPVSNPCFTEDYYPYKLRCYEDKNLGLVKFIGESEPCEILTSLENISQTIQYQIVDKYLHLSNIPADINVSFYNIGGKILYSKTINNENYDIDLSNFGNGLLFCKFQNNLISQTIKIIKL